MSQSFFLRSGPATRLARCRGRRFAAARPCRRCAGVVRQRRQAAGRGSPGGNGGARRRAAPALERKSWERGRSPGRSADSAGRIAASAAPHDAADCCGRPRDVSRPLLRTLLAGIVAGNDVDGRDRAAGGRRGRVRVAGIDAVHAGRRRSDPGARDAAVIRIGQPRATHGACAVSRPCGERYEPRRRRGAAADARRAADGDGRSNGLVPATGPWPDDRAPNRPTSRKPRFAECSTPTLTPTIGWTRSPPPRSGPASTGPRCPGFDSLSSQRVTLNRCNITVAGERATAQCAGGIEIFPASATPARSPATSTGPRS